MERLYSVAFLLLALCASTGYCRLQTVNGTISIQIGTTSGCRFVPGLMTEVLATNAKYGRFLKFEFLPWGRTVRGADGNLICQFGAADCWSNRVQRCALTLLEGNQEAQVQYMGCEFRDPFPAFRQRSLACVYAAGINIVAADFCVSTSYGNSLEDPFQERARKGMVGINRIPVVLFNNQVDLALYNELFRVGLESLICNALKDDPTTGITSC